MVKKPEEEKPSMREQLLKLRKTQMMVIGLWGLSLVLGAFLAEFPFIGEKLGVKPAVCIMMAPTIAAVMLIIAQLRCPYCDYPFFRFPLPKFCPDCGHSLNPDDAEQQ